MRENVFKADCTVCPRGFCVSPGGICDIKQQASEAAEDTERGSALRVPCHQVSQADMVGYV